MSNTDANEWLESHLRVSALWSGKSNTNSDAHCYLAVPVTHSYADANPMLRQVYADSATSP